MAWGIPCSEGEQICKPHSELNGELKCYYPPTEMCCGGYLRGREASVDCCERDGKYSIQYFL